MAPLTFPIFRTTSSKPPFWVGDELIVSGASPTPAMETSTNWPGR